jgi:hypothetical protein
VRSGYFLFDDRLELVPDCVLWALNFRFRNGPLVVEDPFDKILRHGRCLHAQIGKVVRSSL